MGRAWTTWRDRRLLILAAIADEGRPDSTDAAPPGTIGTDAAVAAGEGRLRLLIVQPEGRAALSAAEWIRGARLRPGERLGG